MCGLSGLAGTIGGEHDNVVRDMLYFNGIRGTDSTGVGGVYRDPKVAEPNIIRALGGPWELLDDKKFDKFMKFYYCCILGHNRSATVGMSTIRNAHPFMHSGEYSNLIMGMHNGTLEGCTKSDMKDDAQFSTDSEAIINNLASEGPEKTISKLMGAWALVWYDWHRHTISMIRNDKRPLGFWLSKSKKTLVFGSEISLMRAALSRHYFNDGEYFNLPTDVLHTWKIPKHDEEFTAPTEVALKGKVNFTNMGPSNKTYHGMSQVAQEIRSKFQAPARQSSGTSSKNPIKTSGTTSTGSQTTNILTTGDKQKSVCVGIYPHSPFKGHKDYGEHEGVHIFFDPISYQWREAIWDNKLSIFNHQKSSAIPPKYLPYSMLNVNGNHAFKHVGKKKKKQIFFRGWNETLLSREQLEYYFGIGCLSCGRSPAWGNYVHWLNKNHDFLCEHCGDTPPLRDQWKESA